MRLGPFTLFERKSLAEPTADEFSMFTGLPAGALDPLTLPAVQSCIRLLSEAAASLQLCVEKFDGTNWIRDDRHPAAVLLADQPNDWTSTFGLIRDLVATALTVDKGALAFVNRVGDRLLEVVRYEPANYQIDYSTDGRSEPTYRINNVLTPGANVIHLRGTFTRCPLNMAYDAIQAAKHMERHAGNFFKNGARPSGVLQSPKAIGDEGVKKMLAGWRSAQQGSENAGKTPVLWDGTTYQQQMMNSTDAQFLENRKYQVLEVCRAFRVPPSMIFEMDRATWSNSEQAGKEFLTYSLEPWLLGLEAAMRRALFILPERPTYRIRFDRDDLTRADLTARATAISSLISSRTINPNEGRDWLGLPPRDGGEEFANPNTGASQPRKPADPPANDETRDAT